MDQDIIAFAVTVKRARNEITRQLNRAFRPLGLTALQAEVLFALGENPPMTLRELSGRVVAESGNPSRLVERMVTGGLIQRTTDLDDRRRVRLSLTPTGLDLLARVDAARTPLAAALAAEIDPVKMREVTAFLQHIVDVSPE